MVDAFGSNRVTVKPPERGVFPLDHDGECKEKMNVKFIWHYFQNYISHSFLGIYEMSQAK